MPTTHRSTVTKKDTLLMGFAFVHKGTLETTATAAVRMAGTLMINLAPRAVQPIHTYFNRRIYVLRNALLQHIRTPTNVSAARYTVKYVPKVFVLNV